MKASMLDGSGLSRACSAVLVAVLVLAGSRAADAASCIVPDNGSGTANLPPYDLTQCADGYVSQTAWQIIDGLPPGSTVDMDVRLLWVVHLSGMSGGGLGGERSTFSAFLELAMTGTGAFAGYTRTVNVPVSVGTMDNATRTPGTTPQSFVTDLFQLQGQLPPGDPDFDLLRITAGTDFALPSPGHTTLKKLGSDWAVDSYFDVTYRIDFVGAPGGPFTGRSGSTTATGRIEEGPSGPTIDHYKCYKVKDKEIPAKFAPTTVTLSDDFQTSAPTKVKEPYLVCNPVDKNGEGITSSADQLTCYTIRDKSSPAFSPVIVDSADQLGALRLAAKRPYTVCLPSRTTVVP